MKEIDKLINYKWKKYFEWAVFIPFCFSLAMSALFAYNFVSFLQSAAAVNNLNTQAFISFMLGDGLRASFVLYGTAFLYMLYVIWFLYATDDLLKLLNLNRKVGNSLNIIGIIIGLSFMIFPIYFWFQLKDYWKFKGIPNSWRAVIA